ncbi:unnamed protein product [Brachionus calyciflorus]|uniref:Uncharacterized protein n=1 Tax=Brachionus calyciflorus TaxID=104777 RepID=A0A813N2B8_9BILA|nr:unnamed protein product [Brachionus calyciflorus]
MKDIGARRNRRDSDASAEVPDFSFDYNDSDTLDNEIAEWYTYSEEPEFVWNLNAFNDLLNKHYAGKKWKDLDVKEKKSHVLRLLDYTEIGDKKTRDNACRSILYLCQGTFSETENINEYHTNLFENISLLFDCDTFTVFLELFTFEINNLNENISVDSKYAPCIADNVDMRVILSVLYTILEVIRSFENEYNSKRIFANQQMVLKYQSMRSQLNNELNKPMLARSNELLSSYLFQLINKFCNQNIIVLPIKKIILFLWKCLLFTLGGLDEAFCLKNNYRKLFNLPIINENPMIILSQMLPATPPPNPVDIANEFQFSNPNSLYKRKKNTSETNNSTNGLTKQTKGIDNDDLSLTNGINNSSGRVTQFVLSTSNDTIDSENSDQIGMETDKKEDNESSSVDDSENNTTRPGSPPPVPNEEQKKVLEAANDALSIKFNLSYQTKSLPWQPKVRSSELEAFLDQERKKFLGYGDLSNDLDTLVGLPNPIHESVRILRQHLYNSLADEQIKLEEKFLKYPLSTKEINSLALESPAEILFSNLLTNLPQYLICLLKILLTSVPQTRPKNDSLQIMSDLFPEELSGSHYLTIKLGIDTNRHKEIIIKAISAILLLLLKHFKINHVYQFEFMSQHLLFANCVPLILKFFNLNISSFIQSKNNNQQLDFPNCVIGTQAEIDAEDLENGDMSIFRWRNVFSCINLLRILNKLTKYKRSRVMMLVIFKSAPILKKILRIKQAMLQYYALKLLKMQTRHLGRQWRKTNMSTMSAIYQKVRHRLNDDWAFGNEQETQGWDFQSDECAIRNKIDKYIQRKYKSQEEPLYPDYVPSDNSFFNCVKNDVEGLIPEDFENNYEQWLEEEVFSNEIKWDSLITNDNQSNSLILF